MKTQRDSVVQGADPSPRARNCTFTVQIDAAVESGAYEAPGFRFRFLDGARKQTSAIGSGPGWTPIQDKIFTPESSQSKPAIFRFEQSFPDIAVSEEFAKSIDDDPILSFFLFDHPGLAGTAATPRAPHSKDAKPSAAKAAVAAPPVTASSVEFVPKAFAGLYEMDVSSLLAGSLCIKQVWALDSSATDATLHPDQGGSIFGLKAEIADEQSPAQSLCQLPSASGLKYLSIQVTVDQPLLVGELLEKLNPLTITIGNARRLPGAISQGVGTASSHSPFHRFCKPAFTLTKFFPNQLQAQSSLSTSIGSLNSTLGRPITRVLVTPGQYQNEKIQWNSSMTLLCGRFESLELIDILRFAGLTVEVRDRDLKQEEMLTRLQSKWEQLYTTGIGPSQDQQLTPYTSLHDTSPSNDLSARTAGTEIPGTVTNAAFHSTETGKPLELSVVDEIAHRDWRTVLAQSDRHFSYGAAHFRFSELLNTAKQCMGAMKAEDDKPYMNLKLETDVIGMKRRASPLGAIDASSEDTEPTIDLTPLQKIIREPGAYVSTGASLSIRVTLQSPVELVERSPTAVLLTTRVACENLTAEVPAEVVMPPSKLKFSRMVIIIPYKDSVTLGEVTKAMTTVNLKALPGVPIRSYQMTETEKKDCESGTLDVITGTQIIDSQFRMIVLEGLADKGMAFLHDHIQRKRPNEPQGYRMFANDTLRFTRRLYTIFEIDMKRIKLRYPLTVLMTTPDIYMRAKVSENCHQALSRLSDIRKVQELIEIKHLDLFPTAQMLLEVESKYGESISLVDIHSTCESNTLGTATAHSNSKINNSNEKTTTDAQTAGAKHRTQTLKPATDFTNTSFEQALRNRIERNFLLERKKHADTLQAKYDKKRITAMVDNNSNGFVYMYSGQKLRTQDALQEEQRRRLSKDLQANYTYGHDFQSLALSMINPEALKQTAEKEARKKWTTQRGFIYPAARHPEEYYKHPCAPSEARCEELRQPFVDNVNHPKPVSRGSGEFGSQKGPEFSTLPSKDMIFGGTNGDGTANPDYFRSVHLCGEVLRLEMEEQLKKEQDEWERRLVVDKKQLKFLAHGSTCSLPREKPSQLDKISDILRGPTQSKPIRIVRNATLPSGKRVPLEKPPVTIQNQGEYIGCAAATFAGALRSTDNSQFAVTDTASGKPKDFSFPSTTSILTPPVRKLVTRKEIMPMRETEKKGLFWRNE